MRRILVLLACVLVVAAGCSSGDDDDNSKSDDSDSPVDDSGSSAARDEYVEAALESFQVGDGIPISDEDLECFATSAVDGVGVSTLESADVSPEDWASAEDLSEFDLGPSDDLIAAIIEEGEGCDFDFSELLLGQAPEFSSMGLDEEHGECIATAMGADPELQAGMLEVFATAVVTGDSSGAYESGQGAGQNAMPAAFAACPDAVGAMLLFGAEQGGVVADDEQRGCVTQRATEFSEEEIALLVEQDPSAQDLALEIFSDCGLIPG